MTPSVACWIAGDCWEIDWVEESCLHRRPGDRTWHLWFKHVGLPTLSLSDIVALVGKVRRLCRTGLTVVCTGPCYMTRRCNLHNERGFLHRLFRRPLL